VEQISLTIRFVEFVNDEVVVQERFLEYFPADQSTGEGLGQKILSAIEKHGLKIKNCVRR